MEEDNTGYIKIKYQLDTEKAERLIEELTEIANRYKIRLHCEEDTISIDVSELIKINKIIRLKEDKQ